MPILYCWDHTKPSREHSTWRGQAPHCPAQSIQDEGACSAQLLIIPSSCSFWHQCWVQTAGPQPQTVGTPTCSSCALYFSASLTIFSMSSLVRRPFSFVMVMCPFLPAGTGLNPGLNSKILSICRWETPS